MKKLAAFYLVALIACMTGAADSHAALPEASMLANPCAGCHGTGGISVGPSSPTIAGISRDYFIETMEAYKDDTRPSTIMNRIAKGYSTEEIERLADYFANQAYQGHKQQFDQKLYQRGRALHKKYCEKCHEDGGRWLQDDVGILAGQWSAYLRYMMEDFTSGRRSMSKKMEERVDALFANHGDAGVDQLIHFYAGQQE